MSVRGAETGAGSGNGAAGTSAGSHAAMSGRADAVGKPVDLAERLRFAGIDDEVRGLLRSYRSVISAELPGILDAFYEHVRAFPEVAGMFPDASAFGHARDMQVAHWALIATGNFDAHYTASVRRMGEVHCGLGLEPHWYIGGYSFITGRLLAAVSGERGLARLFGGQGAKAAVALNKAAMLDMDLAISVYFEAARRNCRETLAGLAAGFEEAVVTVVRSVNSAANDLRSSAWSLATASTETMHQADAASVGSLDATRSIEAVTSATEQLAGSLKDVGQKIEVSSATAERALVEAEQITTQVGGLIGAMDRIGGIAETIREIADSTTLLALNATIESARANEAGRGFSVIASEIKQLAVQTTNATVEINSQIVSIRDFSHYVSSAVSGIQKTIQEMNEIKLEITRAIEAQGVATHRTVNNLQQAWQTSAEVANTIGTVTQRAAASNAASAGILSATIELVQYADTLSTEVDQFLGKIIVA